MTIEDVPDNIMRAENTAYILRKFAENNEYIYRKRCRMYIHELESWPSFTWDTEAILISLGEVRYRQGHLLGLMNSAGFKLQENAVLDTLTLDVTKSSEIEGIKLNSDEVRSSIARRLGIELAGTIPTDRNVEGVVEMMLDATQKYSNELTADRLYDWHAALFPTGRSGMQKITVAAWRTPEAGPMQVVSGAMGKERVHFEAPKAEKLSFEMDIFLKWFNAPPTTDAILKAAIAHLWFVTIHPFDDGNGRIARAITDMQLARADHTSQRFYSMSAQILREKAAYYDTLEQTQKGDTDITPWLTWFLNCLFNAMGHTENALSAVITRSQFWKKNRMTALNSRQQYMVDILLDDFYGKLTSSKWAKMTKCSSDTALRDIQDLIEKGILDKETGGGRNTSYILLK